MSTLMMLGDGYDTEFSNTAWDYLLKSHPHDSINGVTQDKTAEDEMYHLAQAEELSDILYQRGIRGLIKHADLSKYDKNDILLLVYNPLPFNRSEVIKVSVDVPREYDAWDIKVTDDEGNDVKVQRIEINELWAGVHDSESRPSSMPCDRFKVFLETGTIPAGGFRIYKVETNRTFERSFVCGALYQETSRGLEIAKNDYTLENEYLIFEVNPNGTIKLTDKTTGKVFDNMHYFEDIGEVGDYWINIRPDNNKIFTSIGQNADIWLENNGELSATIGVRHILHLPKDSNRLHCFRAADSKRSDDLEDFEITSYFTLNKGDKKINVRIEFENNVKDHRLRVIYQTGINAENSYAGGHFNVDKRPVMQKGDNEYWIDMQTLPHLGFVDVTDGKNGVAFVNNSLTEYELKQDGTLALTLLKAVKNTICTDKRLNNEYPDQHGGQCFGKQVCEYAIYPHKGDWQEGKVYNEAQRFNVVLSAVQTGGHSFGNIAANTNLVEIENDNIIMSSLKKAEDRNSIIMRVFNPTDETVKTYISFYKKPEKAYIVSLNENREKEIDITKPLEVAKHKILTLEFDI